jgi:hypothetical protein
LYSANGILFFSSPLGGCLKHKKIDCLSRILIRSLKE